MTKYDHRHKQEVTQTFAAYSTFVISLIRLAVDNPGLFRSRNLIDEYEKEWGYLDSFLELAKGATESANNKEESKKIWSEFFRENACILVRQFYQYLGNVKAHLIQEIEIRGQKAKENLHNFSFFVADMEFYAKQNPDLFDTVSGRKRYEKAWMELEVLNALALCEWEESGPHKSFQAIWTECYQANASVLIDELLICLNKSITMNN